MDPIRSKIIEICLATDLEVVDLVKALEAEIAKLQPFDHREDLPDFEACGLKEEEIHLNIKMPLTSTMSQIVEVLEQQGTKRHLAVGFFKALIENGDVKKVDKHGRPIKDDDDSDLEDFTRHLLGSGKRPGNPLEDLLKMMAEHMGSRDDDDGIPDSPKRCRQEDNSECWKCPHKTICTKFK